MKTMKYLIAGIIIGSVIGTGVGVNIGKGNPILSNPFAEKTLQQKIKNVSGEILEQSGKALEEGGKALQEKMANPPSNQ